MTHIKQTLVATFDHQHAAERALSGLHDSGYGADEVSVLAKDPRRLKEVDSQFVEGNFMEDAGKVGGIFGGVIGAAMGLFALVIPGVGPIVASGAILSVLGGTAIGAAAGGLIGGLAGLGVPQTEAEIFVNSLKEDKILLVVTAGSERILEAKQIIARQEPEEVTERATVWSDGDAVSPLTDQEFERERAAHRRETERMEPNVHIFAVPPSTVGASRLS